MTATTASPFIHLRVHSSYSLAEGAIKVVEDKPKNGHKPVRTDLIHLCLQHDMPAAALTDKGNLFGALEFAQAAAEAGIQPIIGCQISVLRPDQANGNNVARENMDQLVLLVQNELGYRNLLALVTQSFIGDDRATPFVTFEELARHADGLIALSGGVDGAVGRLLLAGKFSPAEATLLQFAEMFHKRFYVEITRHHGGPVGQSEARIEGALIALAREHDLPLVATNDVYFGDADMFEAHDALLCISDKTVIGEENRRRLTPDHRFKSTAEMRALFADIPEACDNTLVVARRCAYTPPSRKPILPAFPTENGRSEADELRAQAEAGLRAMLAAGRGLVSPTPAYSVRDRKAYEDRLNYELGVITKMGFAGYFLIVSDFVKWSKTEGIAVGPGRGSGAGSVVAWSLLITDIDPIRFGLLFERFLNPERVSMPDFDIDFCQERRDEVIRYVQQKYGVDKVAQIITFGTLQARAVLRDVGRVLGMAYGYVDRICKLVPNNPANPVTLRQAIEGEPQLRQLCDGDPTVARMMDIAIRLEGLHRNASTHAAGVVIGDRPLVELVPLYRDPGATLPTTQFNLKTVEAAGLVKFDFLGLKTLDILSQAVDLLRSRGVTVDLANVPLDDPKTFALLAKGDTLGVFQLESAGMRDNLRKLKPNRFEDIIAMNALYRPGPMESIPQYIRCKNGEEPVRYPHPLLEPILEPTFGVFTYQEQVMQAAQVMAGYSLGSADLLRRAMGKKKASEMAAQRTTFVAGARKRGIGGQQANVVFDLMERFAGYGFNKSHSAPYALIAYQTAYIKAHYPAEFFAASMNLEMADTDKLNIFRQELSRHQIVLLPPDINRSRSLFAVEPHDQGKPPAIRYALAAIKGVGAGAMRAVVREREENGRFKNLFDFAERVGGRQINRKQMETLAAAGAFDSLNCNRAQVTAATDLLLKHSQRSGSERASGQTNMFDAADATQPPLPSAKAWDELTRLRNEFRALGFYLSAHPIDYYREVLECMGAVPVGSVASRLHAPGPSHFKLAGVVLAKQERTARSGKPFAFVQLSDSSGAFELTVFSELLAARRELLEAGRAVLIEADVQGDPRSDGEAVRFIARSVDPLAQAVERGAEQARIRGRWPSPRN